MLLSYWIKYYFLIIFYKRCVFTRAVHGSGRVGFGPNPDSTRRRWVEGQSNLEPTAKKIDQVDFEWG